MIHEAILACDGVWSQALEDMVSVDFYYLIDVKDGSFSHDWHPGAVEEKVDAEIESVHIVFMWNGQTVMFDLDSNHTCMLDADEDLTTYRMGLDNLAILEAVQAFKYPEN